MAYQEITNGEAGLSVRGKINSQFSELFADSLLLDESPTYSGQESYQAVGILNNGNGALPFEFINIGNPGFVPQGTETRNLVTVAVIRIGGNLLLTRNIAWDQANLRWTTPHLESDAYGSGMLEMGGEGINMHVSAAGAQFYSLNTMTFSFRQDGARGVPGYTTGQVNQSMAPLFSHYATDSYQSGKLRSWNPSTAVLPLIHLHSDEAKGSDNELALFEINSSTAGAWPAVYFAKSRGTLAAETTVADTDILGLIGFKGHDGTDYEITAGIRATISGTVSNNTVPTKLELQTSATNSSGRATGITILPNQNVILHALPTAAAGLAAGTLWNNSGVINVA